VSPRNAKPGNVSHRRYWEREGWCTGVIAHSAHRRDSQVHHVVYDVDSNPSWELNVSLAPSQAGEKWKIPKPAKYLHRAWEEILPPETSKKGKKRAFAAAAAGTMAAPVVAGTERLLKRPRREHTDEEIETVAVACEESGSNWPLERIMCEIRALKRALIDDLAHKHLEAGLEQKSALHCCPLRVHPSGCRVCQDGLLGMRANKYLEMCSPGSHFPLQVWRIVSLC
jgi:hypothetical protein